jgi:hypothetical protein
VSDVNSIIDKYLYNKCLIDSGALGFSFGMTLMIILRKGITNKCAYYPISYAKLTLRFKLKRMLAFLIGPIGVIAFF